MAKKVDTLEGCKNWKDLRKFADHNGLPVLRTTGGHEIRGNAKGSMPFSTHEKEIGKSLLHNVKKQIALLITVCLALFVAFQFMV
jgi:hypothetical protein